MEVNKEEMIPPQDQALLEWHDIQFFVQVPKPKVAQKATGRLLEEDIAPMVPETGIPAPTLINRG